MGAWARPTPFSAPGWEAGERSPTTQREGHPIQGKGVPSRYLQLVPFYYMSRLHRRSNTSRLFLRNRLPSLLQDEPVACPCGETPQTAEHALLECPILDDARRKHLTECGCVRSLDQLFNDPQQSTRTLGSLEDTHVCAKSGRVVWDPG